MGHSLPFPVQRPPQYIKLEHEPVFDAQRHLDLSLPTQVRSLSELGYNAAQVKACPSDFAVSSAFKIFSDEGLTAVREICLKVYKNRNASIGTGVHRLGSYVRGAGYRSQFLRDFCESPDLAAHISDICGVSLARHSVPAVACGINYAPKDIRKAVDNWHIDSVAYDCVILLTDPETFDGGEFQYFNGTKMQGRAFLGVEGEEGIDMELPADQIVTVDFPAAGYGFLQQGNMIFHRACRLRKPAERITMIPAFVVDGQANPLSVSDTSNSVNMASWGDPGIVAELMRHEAWQAARRLQHVVDKVTLHDDNKDLIVKLDSALASLMAFRESIDRAE